MHRLTCGLSRRCCMAAMLGVFFSVHSTVLIEDVPLTEEDVLPDPTPTQRIYSLYNQMNLSYMLSGLVSCCQMRLTKQKKYLVHWTSAAGTRLHQQR